MSSPETEVVGLVSFHSTASLWSASQKLELLKLMHITFKLYYWHIFFSLWKLKYKSRNVTPQRTNSSKSLPPQGCSPIDDMFSRLKLVLLWLIGCQVPLLCCIAVKMWWDDDEKLNRKGIMCWSLTRAITSWKIRDWDWNEKSVSSSFSISYKETFFPLCPSKLPSSAYTKECLLAVLWNAEGIFNIHHSWQNNELDHFGTGLHHVCL